MRMFPILLLNLFGPTPETSLPDCCRCVCRKIFVQVKTLGPELIDDESHFVLITRNRCASFDFRRQVCGGNFGLPHSHVAHLRPFEVCAVANRVNPLLAGYTHPRIDVEVTLFVSDPEV